MAENKVSGVMTQQILDNVNNHIAQIESELATVVNLEIEVKKRISGMGPRLMSYVQAVFTGVKVHANELPSTYSVSEFEKDLNLLPQIDAIISRIGQTSEKFKNNRKQLCHELYQQANEGYSILKVLKKIGHTAVNFTLGKIAATRKRKSYNTAGSTFDVPMAGSSQVNNIRPGSSLLNCGETVLELHRGSDLAIRSTVGPIQVIPGARVKIPKGFTQILVKNLSSDKQGKFTVNLVGS